MELTDAIQDYLKEIYKLETSGRRASTSSLARELGVSSPSVTSMLKKLALLDLSARRIGARLTLKVERSPRGDPSPPPVEQYLSQTLGLRSTRPREATGSSTALVGAELHIARPG